MHPLKWLKPALRSRSNATLLTGLSLALAGAVAPGAALAQDLPPALPGGPPAAGPPPDTLPGDASPTPSAPPQVVDNGPLPTGTTPAAPQDTSGSPAELPAMRPVRVAGDRAVLRGRSLRVALACSTSGTVRISTAGKRIGGARFACSNGGAVASVRISRAGVRALTAAARPRVRVLARAAGESHRRVLVVKRSSAGARSSARWSVLGGTCGSSWAFDPGFVFTGQPYSNGDYQDSIALLFWAWSQEYGWQQLTGWWGWFQASGSEGQLIARTTLFRYIPNVWVATGVQSYNHATKTIDFHWITPTSSTLGLTERVHGVFCKVTV